MKSQKTEESSAFLKKNPFVAKILVVLACALLFSPFLEAPSEASTITAIQKRGELRVALENEGWGNFLQWNQGMPEGFCVDLAEAIAQDLGVPCRYISLPWSDGEDETTIANLLEGKPWEGFDIIASVVAITEERKKNVWFSTPYALVGQMLIFNKEHMESTVFDFQSLQNKKVAFPKETTSETAARSLPSSNALIPVKKTSEAFQALLAGRVDAVIIDSHPALFFIQEHLEIGILDKLLSREAYALVLPSDSDPKFRSMVNRVVEAQKKQLQERWLR